MLSTPIAHRAVQTRTDEVAEQSLFSALAALLAALERVRQSRLDRETWQRLDTRLLADLGLEHQAWLLA